MIQDIENIKLFSEFLSYEVSGTVAWTRKLYYNKKNKTKQNKNKKQKTNKQTNKQTKRA
jgi:hypothetical protein